MMRVVCVSDTHSMHRTLGTIPDGDVLVHAGDFTQTGKNKSLRMLLKKKAGPNNLEQTTSRLSCP